MKERLTADGDFDVVVQPGAHCAIGLRERRLDAAMLSVLEYARESSLYRIVPGVAISSREATETIVLHFRDEIHTINTLAVDPASPAEAAVARILLGEQFDLEPRIVPVAGPLDAMLEKADAALLVGDAALRESARHRNKLDLIEVWNDLTELPFVHAFWCGPEDALDHGEIAKITAATTDSIASSSEGASNTSAGQGFSVGNYLDSFSFALGQETEQGAIELIRYAYFHGVLPDIADLHYFGQDKPGSSPGDSLSLN